MAWNKILSCLFSRVVFHQEQTRIRNGSEEPTTLEQTWSSDTLHSKKHSHVLLKMFLTEKRKKKKSRKFLFVCFIDHPAGSPGPSCVLCLPGDYLRVFAYWQEEPRIQIPLPFCWAAICTCGADSSDNLLRYPRRSVREYFKQTLLLHCYYSNGLQPFRLWQTGGGGGAQGTALRTAGVRAHTAPFVQNYIMEHCQEGKDHTDVRYTQNCPNVGSRFRKGYNYANPVKQQHEHVVGRPSIESTCEQRTALQGCGSLQKAVIKSRDATSTFVLRSLTRGCSVRYGASHSNQ
ncbi:hypothetical protein L345_09352, partial [Ophiophagus hannah]